MKTTTIYSLDELFRASITSLMFSPVAYCVLLSGELAKFKLLKKWEKITKNNVKLKSAQREDSVEHQNDSPLLKNYKVKLSFNIVSSIVTANVKFVNKVEAKKKKWSPWI